VLSNITAGTQAQIQMVINSNIVPILVNIILHDEQQVKSEAIWALSNTTAMASPAQFGQLVEQGLIRGLGSILKLDNTKMLNVTLEGLRNVLKCGKENFQDE
jgi:importin subunit alpha-1